MVSIGFKAVYLLLALFALPQVVAAPGTAALSSRDLFPVPDWEKREALLAFNKIRSKYKLPHLVWDDYLEIFAAEKASSCKDEDGKRYGNVAHASTILEAIKIWSSPNSQDPDFIRTREARKVGCAIPNCVGTKLVVCMYGK